MVASRARVIHHDTPNSKSRGGQFSVTFTVLGRKSWPLSSSYPQAKHWKTAKTRAPASYLAAYCLTDPSAMVAAMVCDASEPLERRRNNAFAGGRGACGQIFTIRRNPPVRGVARPRSVTLDSSANGLCPMASAVSCEGLPWRCHTKAFPWSGSREALPWAKPSHGRAADGSHRATHPRHGRRKDSAGIE